MSPPSIIIFLIVGALAGLVATRGIDGPRLGVAGNVAVGIAGAFAGGFLLSLSSRGLAGWLGTFFAAALGAMALLATLNKLLRDRRRD